MPGAGEGLLLMFGVVREDRSLLGKFPVVATGADAELDFVTLARGDCAVGPTGGLEPSPALDLDLQITLPLVLDGELEFDGLATPDRLSRDGRLETYVERTFTHPCDSG